MTKNKFNLMLFNNFIFQKVLKNNKLIIPNSSKKYRK